MMGSRTREKVERMFEVFVEIASPSGKEEAPFIIQQYPPDYDDKETLSIIPKFAYPCPTDASNVDHFTFVLTDLDSMFRFGHCRHTTGHQTCLCIVSLLPWFEIFYKMLDLLAEITNRSERNNVTNFLQVTYNHEVPVPRASVTIVAKEDMFNFTAPDPNVLPSIPGSRNLTEYYNAVDPYNMMVIFASMLHERRIYMISKKLSRLTACIHAAEALLYPMHWQHLFIPVLPASLLDYISAPMPYLIGVHSNLVEKLKQNRMDVGDAVIVDLDNNTVTTEYDDLGDLPEDVSSYLKRSLKADAVINSMIKTGDAISMAFLHALVRLIGGYRDALKFRPGEPITFDPEAFIHTRQSQSTQAFLEGMLTLQIFQQFIYDRLKILNSGIGFRDVFEVQAIMYADKLNSQSKYKEWLKTAKRSGKKSWHDLRGMVKEQGKKAMADIKTKFSGLTDTDEKRGNNEQMPKSVAYTKPSKQRPVTAQPDHLRPARPPRPPLPTRVTQLEYERGNKSAQPAPDIQDDGLIPLNYQRVDMNLMDDRDIQAAMSRSTSDEKILNHREHTNSSNESDTESSDSEKETDGAISFGVLRSSDEGLNSTPSSDDSSPQQPRFATLPRTDNNNSITSSLTYALPPRPLAGPRTKMTPLPAGQGPAAQNRTTGTSSSKSDLSRRNLKDEKPSTIAPLQDGPLIWFNSSESDATGPTSSDSLTKSSNAPVIAGSVSNESKEVTDDNEVNMRTIQRSTESRVSLVRSRAFRRETPVVPLRSHYLDDTDELDGLQIKISPDTDPLSEFNSLTSSNKGQSSTASSSRDASRPLVRDPLSSHSPRQDNSDLLKHEWSLATLATGPSIRMPVTAQASRTSFPNNTLMLKASQKTPSVHHTLPTSSLSSIPSKGSAINNTRHNQTGSKHTLNQELLMDKQGPKSSQASSSGLHQPLQVIKSNSTTFNSSLGYTHNSRTQSSISPRIPGAMNFVPPTISSSAPLIHGSIKHVQHHRSGGVNSSISNSSSLETQMQKQSDSISDLQGSSFSGSTSLEEPNKQQKPDGRVPPSRPPNPRREKFN